MWRHVKIVFAGQKQMLIQHRKKHEFSRFLRIALIHHPDKPLFSLDGFKFAPQIGVEWFSGRDSQTYCRLVYDYGFSDLVAVANEQKRKLLRKL